MNKKNNRLFYLILYSTVLSLFIFSAIVYSNFATAVGVNSVVPDRRCIIIDPGHGGEDGGATSCAGILESRYNLEISLKLNDILQMFGYQTKMIRTSDISIYTQGTTIAQKKVSDLKQRVAIANSTENAIIISIHQNYFSDERYSGAQVFYAANDDSKTLAQQLQTEICTHLQKNNHRTIKKASGIYLMEHIQCTGVLVECGFISNYAEEAKLRNENYQKDLCCVIASGVCNFLDRDSIS